MTIFLTWYFISYFVALILCLLRSLRLQPQQRGMLTMPTNTDFFAVASMLSVAIPILSSNLHLWYWQLPSLLPWRLADVSRRAFY